jgi:hypothetical protein
MRFLLPLLLVSAPLARSSATSAPDEGAFVRRMQIGVRVCDVSDAGTDDNVRVAVNSANTTVLDYPHDDFERQSVFKYEMTVTGVSVLRDIAYLQFSKNGSDGLCVQELAFYVNDQLIFDKVFPRLWLDNDGSHSRSVVIAASELRASALWSTWHNELVYGSLIAPEWTRALVTTLVAQTLHEPGNRAYWRATSDAVVMRVGTYDNPADNNYLTFLIKLKVDVPWYPDPDLYLSFDLEMCKPAGHGRKTISFEMKSLRAWPGQTWVGVVPVLNFVDIILRDTIWGAALASLDNMATTVGPPSGALPMCPSLRPDGSISMVG